MSRGVQCVWFDAAYTTYDGRRLVYCANIGANVLREECGVRKCLAYSKRRIRERGFAPTPAPSIVTNRP